MTDFETIFFFFHSKFSKSNLADIFENDSSPEKKQHSSSAALKYIPAKANQLVDSASSSTRKHSNWNTDIAKVITGSKL